MNAAEAQEFRIRKRGNHPKHALLFGNAQPRLKTHKIPHATTTIFLAQLHHCMRSPVAARITQTNWFHRTKTQTLPPATRHFLNRHAAFEVRDLVKFVRGELIGGRQGLDEGVILLARHGAVQIGAFITRAFHSFLVPARRTKRNVVINAVNRNNRRNRVIKREILDAQSRADRRGQCVGRQRPRGHNSNRGQLAHFFVDDRDVRMCAHPCIHALREYFAIDGQRRTTRHARGIRTFQNHRAQLAHLRLQ